MLNSTMNTATSVLCTIEHDYDKAMFISQIVWRICGLLCVAVGLPGNVLQGIIMLNKTNRKEPTSFYFVAIAVCEVFYLIGIFWIRLIAMLFIRLDPRQILSCGIVYAIIIGPTSASNLLIASMYIDRSIMILYPCRYRLLVTRRYVLIRISLIILTIILVMIPHHFSLYYDAESHTNFLCELRPCVRRWETILWPMIHTVLFIVVPSSITCTSSIILFRNRCHHRRVRQQILSIEARRMQKLSLIIVLFSFSGLIAMLPACILHILVVHDHIANQNPECSVRHIRYRILLYWLLSLMTINYSTKFYARLIISTPFRRDFARMIGCNNNDHNQHPPTRSMRHDVQQRSSPLLTHRGLKNPHAV